jgi:hypothetical protein
MRIETKPRPAIDQNDVKAVRRNSDRVAEKFGTFAYSKAEHDWARISRDAMRNDPAAIAARKISRAIPVTKDAIVTTKRGYAIVTISRVERAANVETIRRQLYKAVALESAAMDKRATAEDAEARKTHLGTDGTGYAPKAVKAASKRLSGVADREHARVRKLRVKLARAASQQVAQNLTYSRVGDVRLSLRPQSMANRVALIVADIPARKDVHPFRELPHIRSVTGTTAIAISWNPELELIRAEDAAELAAVKAAAIAAREANQAAINARVQAALDTEESIRVENMRREYNARRALAAVIRRQNAKKYGRQKKMK